MDAEQLAKALLSEDLTADKQAELLAAIKMSVAQAKEVRQKKIGENARLVVGALKKIEADIRSTYDELGNKITQRVATIKDGKDGKNGVDGRAGKDGRPGRDGRDGAMGPRGANGADGRDGEDGVSVTDAHIDFDGSLIISLSSGRTINVGEVVAPDLAEKIKVITNGGGTSQTVLDTLASLQQQIDDLIPSQTGNAGKFLTTNGSVLSWASVAGGLTYQGTWNAATNTPTLTSSVGTNGYYYIVATAGSTNLDGITDWQIGDWLLFNGSNWQKIDQSNLVTSVNGQTGAVSLTTTDINEGTNLYYTDVRARGAISAGTGISYNSGTGVVTNAAPDQTVALTAGAGISTSGTYPNFTITNSAPDQTVALTAGTGISTSGTYPNFTITNSAPDQTVALTGAGTTSISGTYPNFTITSNDQYVGTVTSVGGTGTVNGISLSGTVTSSGNLTLGGTLSGVSLSTQVTGTLPIANGGTNATTASDARAALGVAIGTDVQAYSANLTTYASTGIGFRNRMINGAFSVAQRGTSFVSGANNDDTYNLDRWYVLSDGNDAVDITQNTAAAATGDKYCIALDVETANKKFGIAQIIENINCFDLQGQTVTLSFKAKVSSTTKLDNVKCAIVAWSGTADTVTSDIISAWGAEGTNPTLIANATYENTPANLNVTTSWATYSVSAAVDTASTSNVIVLIWSDVTDTTAGDFLYLTNVQLEAGTVASAFERRDYGRELMMCQRYYYKIFPNAVTKNLTTSGNSANSTTGQFMGNFPVTMRTAPTALEQSGTANQYNIQEPGINGAACSGVPTFNSQTTDSSYYIAGTVSSGLTAGRFALLRTDATNGASAYLAWSAEL